MQLKTRRWVGRFIRLGLVGLAVLFVGLWASNKASARAGKVRVQTAALPTDALASGDMRILSRDSSVELVLQGSKLLAGLSPQMVEKVRKDVAAEAAKETTGFGGAIASAVTKSVSSAIAWHITYPVDEIGDIRYEDGRIVIEDRHGKELQLLGGAKVNNRKVGESFSEEDARRFIEAVRARQRELR